VCVCVYVCLCVRLCVCVCVYVPAHAAEMAVVEVREELQRLLEHAVVLVLLGACERHLALE
jgi:hypothetical protein